MMNVVVAPRPLAVAEPLGETEAWRLLRALAARARGGRAIVRACGLRLDGSGELDEVELGQGWLDVYPGAVPLYHYTVASLPGVDHLLDLYLPLCVGRESNALVVAHVGQSLDGQIATSTGASCFITGSEDLVHTHRLRALFDAVLVGRATVACDDPRLTTRLVDGDCPTRVVVDPRLHAPADRNLFRDGAAPTLLLCEAGRAGGRSLHGFAEIVEVAATDALLPVPAMLASLRQRGLRRIFVEGGGITVSHFLQAGALDRLHVTVSPIFLGQGRPGLALPKIDRLEQALRPEVRRFVLGPDTLFDCRFPR